MRIQIKKTNPNWVLDANFAINTKKLRGHFVSNSENISVSCERIEKELLMHPEAVHKIMQNNTPKSEDTVNGWAWIWDVETKFEFEFDGIKFGKCLNAPQITIEKTAKFRPKECYETQFFGWDNSYKRYFPKNTKEYIKTKKLPEGWSFVEYHEGHIDGWGFGDRAGLRIEKQK